MRKELYMEKIISIEKINHAVMTGTPGPGVKFCVNVFRQSQEWRWKAGRILA